MSSFFLVILINSKVIIEFPELEKRSAKDVCKDYQNNYVWTPKSKYYIPRDDCTYGTHSTEDIEMTTKRVNFFRHLVGLSKIPQSTNKEYINKVNQACLVMDKNGVYGHNLSNPNLKCWSSAAQDGARFSNLCYFSDEASSAQSIQVYMEDTGVPSLGHRRWVLNPPLSQVVTGASLHYSALMVLRMPDSTEPCPVFIAYPPPGPVPSDLIYKRWHFSRYYKNAFYDDEHDFMPDDTKVQIKCENGDVKVNPVLDSSNGAMYPGAVIFNGGNIPAGSYCKVAISSESADTEWRYTIQSITCENGKAKDVNPNAFKKGLSAGAKAGIAVAVILVVAVIIIAVAIVVKKRKEERKKDLDLRLIAV